MKFVIRELLMYFLQDYVATHQLHFVNPRVEHNYTVWMLTCFTPFCEISEVYDNNDNNTFP